MHVPSSVNPSSRSAPTRGSRPAASARRKSWPVPLTVLAELLYCDTSTPYRAAERFGLEPWLRARVREFLTKGAWYCQELDLERAIRFNAAYLARRAEIVLDRRQEHRGNDLDGKALAEVLCIAVPKSGGGFVDVWLAFIDDVADGLVQATRSGYVEDVRWSDAERYLDAAVAPRPRTLKRKQEVRDGPLALTGGYRRLRRIMDGLMSRDPKVVDATLKSWRVRRFLRPDECGELDWIDKIESLGFESVGPGSGRFGTLTAPRACKQKKRG